MYKIHTGINVHNSSYYGRCYGSKVLGAKHHDILCKRMAGILYRVGREMLRIKTNGGGVRLLQMSRLVLNGYNPQALSPGQLPELTSGAKRLHGI